MATLPFDMEIEDIAALAAIIRKNDLEELRLTDEEMRMKLVIKGNSHSRQAPCEPPAPPPPQVIVLPAAANPQTDNTAQTSAANASKAPSSPSGGNQPDADDSESGTTVKAPIVGTYYAAPAPGKPPFVTVGQHIKKGDVIMIIETMKLMNEIQSDVDGVVSKILVKDGQAVEYDQPIMIINN